jgi:hypothetical protein
MLNTDLVNVSLQQRIYSPKTSTVSVLLLFPALIPWITLCMTLTLESPMVFHRTSIPNIITTAAAAALTIPHTLRPRPLVQFAVDAASITVELVVQTSPP